MLTNRKDRIRARRRTSRVRRALKRSGTMPRISVFRSLKYVYAQVIDDKQHLTLAACSSLELKNLKGDKKTVAHAIGLELAKRAKEKGVGSIVFDRGRFAYRGRIKALADGLREGGLTF